MLRRSHYWLALLWVMALGVGPALAQPVIDQFVAGAQVIAKKECALLVVNFNVRLRYASHFPQNSGDELRISLSLIDLPVTEQRIFRREGVQVINGKLAGIRSAAVDLDQSRGPVLRIQFEHPVSFLVTQSKSFDSIAVAISQKGSPAACNSIVGRPKWRRCAARRPALTKVGQLEKSPLKTSKSWKPRWMRPVRLWRRENSTIQFVC